MKFLKTLPKYNKFLCKCIHLHSTTVLVVYVHNNKLVIHTSTSSKEDIHFIDQ